MTNHEERPNGQKAPFRAEVLMAGIGGRGVLYAGQVLAQAALSQYPHVVWFPSYATQVRGGPCECTTIFGDSPIASPLLFQAKHVIVMVATQLKPYQARVAPGGLLITEKAGVQEGQIARQDIKVMIVPALETAMQMGGAQAANLVLLGAYIGATGVLPAEVVEQALGKRGGGRWGDTQARNLEAFRRGIELGAPQGM